MMFFSYLMLRNLVPETMTATEQRMVDEQLGQIAAALARARNSIATRILAVAALPAGSGPQPPTFRNPDLDREPDLAARR